MKTFALSSFIAALVLAGVLQGSFIHTILTYGVAIWILGPLVSLLALWTLWCLMIRRLAPPYLRQFWLVLAVLGLSLGLSMGMGKALNRWQIQNTRDFVSQMVPLLENYRGRQGRYPTSLNELGDIQPPSLLRERNSYTTTGHEYTFEYWDPAGMMNGYVFNSQTREWTAFD